MWDGSVTRPSTAELAVGRSFPDDGSSVGDARVWATGTLGGWGLAPHSQLSDDIVLCVSELVSNTIQHAQSASDVEMRLDHGTILLMVTDQRSDLRIPLDPVTDAVTGRSGHGLGILGYLASRWGVNHSPVDQQSKTVWCQFDHR